MSLSSLQLFYSVLACVGVVATWYFNLQARDVNYIADLYSTSASASFTNDLLVVVTTFLLWSFVETKRLGMPIAFWAVCFILTFLIAAAMTIPVFMAVRERYVSGKDSVNSGRI